MFVEFIGCSGAGKTTLAKNTLVRLADCGVRAADSQDLVAQSTRTAWVKNDSMRNLLQSIVLAPSPVELGVNHRRLLSFAVRIITRDAESPLDWCSRTRSTLRLIASHRMLLTRRTSELVVLVDEGLLNAAHNLFVYASRGPRLREVRSFASMVSVPDMIVHVRVPLDVALVRTMRRPDPPIRTRSPRHLEAFLRHGQQVFEMLAQTDPWRDRVLSVSSVADAPADTAAVVRQIVELIRDRLSMR